MLGVSELYPNPITGSVREVKFNLLSSCPTSVSWKVYTVDYKRVYEDTVEVVGLKTLAWRLTDSSGRRVAAGVYYLQFNSGTNTVIRKLLVLN